MVTTSRWSPHPTGHHILNVLRTSQWWRLRTQRSILGTFLSVLGKPELRLLLELTWLSASISSFGDRSLEDLGGWGRHPADGLAQILRNRNCGAL